MSGRADTETKEWAIVYVNGSGSLRDPECGRLEAYARSLGLVSMHTYVEEDPYDVIDCAVEALSAGGVLVVSDLRRLGHDDGRDASRVLDALRAKGAGIVCAPRGCRRPKRRRVPS